MAEPVARDMSSVGEDPSEIAEKSFATVRRGYDPSQVRGYLGLLAAELGRARERERELIGQLEAAETALAAGWEHIDEETLSEKLGEEAARLLRVARESAAQRAEEAEEAAAQLIASAEEDAARLQAEADAAASAMRAEAEELLSSHRSEADDARGAARAAAEAEGRAMLDEAKAVRSRVLEDMSHKRHAARVQVERLRAGRDRLLTSFDAVQKTLDEVRQELQLSLAEAKVVADSAARRTNDEPRPTPEELEAEVAAARLSGLTEPTADPDADAGPEPVAAEASDGEQTAEPETPPEGGDDEPDDDSFVEVEASAEFESVRVLDPEPAPEPQPAEADAAQPDAAQPDAAQPGQEAQEAPVAEPDAVDEPLAEPAEESPEAAEGSPGEEPEPDAPVAEEAAPDDLDPEPALDPVDDLFARIRASQPADEDDIELVEVTRTVERRFKKVLADEQNEIIEQIRRGASDPSWTSPAAHGERYASAVQDQVARVWEITQTRGRPMPAHLGGVVHKHTAALAERLRVRVVDVWATASDTDDRAVVVRACYRELKRDAMAPAADELVKALHAAAA